MSVVAITNESVHLEFITSFKQISETKRCGESTRMKQKYPDRSCIIVDRADNTSAPKIDKHKF